MTVNWSEVRLGDVAGITIGRTPPRNDASYWTRDLTRPFCTIADMLGGGQIDPVREGVTLKAETDGKAKRVPADSLLLSFKLTIGRVGFAARDLFPNEAIACIEPQTADVNKRFLALALEAQDLGRYAGRAVKGGTLNGASLRAIELRIPPLEEQRRIVELISGFDRSVQAAAGVETAAAALREALLGELDERAADARFETLRAVVSSARAGGTPSRSCPEYYGGSVPWLKSAEVRNDNITTTEERITELGIAKSSAWVVPTDAIVVAMYGATAGAVGQIKAEMATNQAVLALIADTDKVSPRFVFHWLSHRSAAMKRRALGAAQPNLSKERVLEEKVPLLEMDDQMRWARLLDAVLVETNAARECARSLLSARGAIIAQLLQSQRRGADELSALR